jgi:hypothetical protein
MPLTIISDGTVNGTRVIDKETKVELKNVKRIIINIEAGQQLVEAVVEVHSPILIIDNIETIKKISVQPGS